MGPLAAPFSPIGQNRFRVLYEPEKVFVLIADTGGKAHVYAQVCATAPPIFPRWPLRLSAASLLAIATGRQYMVAAIHHFAVVSGRAGNLAGALESSHFKRRLAAGVSGQGYFGGGGRRKIHRVKRRGLGVADAWSGSSDNRDDIARADIAREDIARDMGSWARMPAGRGADNRSAQVAKEIKP
jgi:hypothetical protein